MIESKIAVAILALAVLSGCTPSSGDAKARSAETRVPIDLPEAPISNTDPCATHLHDVCGALLLYFAKNQHLPDRLEELLSVPGFDNLDFNCPVSKARYLYNPIGVQDPGLKRRIILYDPMPSHSGHRWTVTIEEPTSGSGALVTRVVALPEANFRFTIRAR